MSGARRQKPKNGGWKKGGGLGNRHPGSDFRVAGAGLGAVGNGEFRVDIIYMGFDGADFDGVGDGDFLVGFAFGQEAKHEVFLGGKEGEEVGLGADLWCGRRAGWPSEQEAGGEECDGYQGQVIVEFEVTVDDQLADDLEADDDGGGDQADAEQPGIGLDKGFKAGGGQGCQVFKVFCPFCSMMRAFSARVCRVASCLAEPTQSQ